MKLPKNGSKGDEWKKKKIWKGGSREKILLSVRVGIGSEGRRGSKEGKQ